MLSQYTRWVFPPIQIIVQAQYVTTEQHTQASQHTQLSNNQRLMVSGFNPLFIPIAQDAIT